MIRIAALLALLIAAPAAAAPLDWLVGRWQGTGTRMGAATEATLEVRPALGGRFVELSYVSSGFEGRAFYRPVEGARWRGEWFDIRGVHFGIDAEAGERSLTANWGSEASERGRTVYRLLDDGRLELVDHVIGRDGASREFARHLLTRTQ
jgi:hypothetical protein